MDKKLFDILELKSVKEENGYYITGIANNKNQADAYGDVPTNFEGKPVYDLSRFKKNPVMLINHDNSVQSIIGTFIKLEETKQGLEFKAKLMDNPQTDAAKHAIQAIKEGHLRALSIGGIWRFEDPKNPSHLTKAYIHEISLVAVPADEDALADIPQPKKVSDDVINELKEKVSKGDLDEIESLIGEFKDIYVDDKNKNNKEQ